MHDSWLIPLRDTHIPSPHQERVFLMSTHINLNKLPEITLAFWVMKICATTLGETAGDLLSMTLNVGYAMRFVDPDQRLSGDAWFAAVFQNHNPVLYWIVILSTSTAGTTMSDFMDRTLGLGYASGSLILISLLITIFAVWRLSEKSLSVTASTPLGASCSTGPPF
jgi:uncharacterized membrane-anchored protein